jgi:hypothetical protein
MVGCRVSGVAVAVPHIEDVDTAGREGDLKRERQGPVPAARREAFS